MALPPSTRDREHQKFEQDATDNGTNVRVAIKELDSSLFPLVPNVDYDFIDIQQTSSTVETYVFKTGGSGGSTVLTIVVTYTDATKSDLDTVEYS